MECESFIYYDWTNVEKPQISQKFATLHQKEAANYNKDFRTNIVTIFLKYRQA